MKTLYCLVALVLLASFVVAESNIEIVFDSSASMSEQIEGERKIDIAKSVVTDYLNSVSEANFALRLYGHRSSECTDTELVLPFGSEKSLINAAVQKMEPVGLTPIEHSLRQAARDLPRSQENFIILVSDGEETCGGDPCKAVRELKESGIGFVLYAVGFGIDEAGRAQLECMAKEGGGQYFDTSDADSLANAFQKIDARRMTRLAVGSRDPQQGTPAQKEPPMMGTFDVPDVQIYDSDRRANLGISPTVVNKETGGLLDFGDFAYFYPEAGTYDLRVDYRDLWLKNIEPFWIDDVVVEEGEENVVYAQVDTGKLTITLYKNKAKEKAALGPNVYDCRGRTDQECTSMDSEFFLTPDSIGLLNPSPSFDLRPGVYDIYVTGSGCALCPVANILFKGVRIEPGKVAKLEVCPVEEGTSECPGEIGRVGIAPWSEQYKQITVVNYGLEATGQTSGSGVKGPSATPSADTFGFNQPITDYSPIKPPAPSQPADPLLIILILAIVAVVAIFLGVFVFSKKSEKPVAKPTADGQTSSTLTDTEEVKKLVAQKADIEEKLRIAKARYYKREMDEGTFRQIVTKNQEELIDIESQIRKLDKRVKKLEDTVY